MLIYKMLLTFLFPPGIFILIFFILFFMSFKLDKNKTSLFIRYISLSFGIILYLISIGIISNRLAVNLENKYKVLSIEEYKKTDAIIVLGSGIKSFAPKSLSDELGIPTDVALARLIEAARLYKIENKKIFISGGQVYKNIKTESIIYKEFLLELGINEKDIIIETKSKTTFENAKFTKELLEKYNIEKPILVTSASHMARSVYTFNKFGVVVIPSPCQYLTGRDKISYRSFLPNIQSNYIFTVIFWEKIGMVYYKIKK